MTHGHNTFNIHASPHCTTFHSILYFFSQTHPSKASSFKPTTKHLHMILEILLILFILSNALALLFSQKYQHSNYFIRWYYKNVLQRILKNHNYGNILRWTVPIFYCSLIGSFSLLYYTKLMDYEITDNRGHSITLVHLHPVENYIFIPVLTISNLCLVYLCYRRAFTISKKATFLYQYDYILYHPNTLCRTCQAPKPARSKHCTVCGECIPAVDHHCIWLNACVSQSNLLWFDALLLANLCSLLYVAVRSALIITPLNQQLASFLTHSTADKGTLIAQFKTARKNILTLFLLASCFLMVITWFVSTQIKLIINGMSTTESDKWFVIHSLIYSGLVYKISGKLYVITEDSKKDGSFDQFNSINFYDTKVYSFDHSMENCLVRSPEEIVNIYDKGSFMGNLKERWCL